MKSVLSLASLFVLAPLLAFAGAEPTPAEVKKVLDFYYAQPAGSPVLVETRICSDVSTDGDQKNECSGTIASKAVPVGRPSYLWMNFMVPSGAGSQKILVQFEHDGVTRLTRQVDVSAAIRYRTWKKFELDRPGTWSVKILHDRPDGIAPINALVLEAKPEMITSSSD